MSLLSYLFLFLLQCPQPPSRARVPTISTTSRSSSVDLEVVSEWLMSLVAWNKVVYHSMVAGPIRYSCEFIPRWSTKVAKYKKQGKKRKKEFKKESSRYSTSPSPIYSDEEPQLWLTDPPTTCCRLTLRSSTNAYKTLNEFNRQSNLSTLTSYFLW